MDRTAGGEMKTGMSGRQMLTVVALSTAVVVVYHTFWVKRALPPMTGV